MIISLITKPGAPLEIRPDPAIVHVGDFVAWEMYIDPQWAIERIAYPWASFESPVRWTIYFQNRHPFRKYLRQDWSAIGFPEKKTIVQIGKAEEPGDFKYGIRMASEVTGQQLSDDDPWLIVRP